ncbi:wax ester synthase/diacylglycerol acyltransferase 4 isoform X1 [Nicotiana tabacum]|uniref:O-acyltransferase WSD1 isoform X1 n=2 Tax=Nicotiana TaxID=4085 RepID=A0A1S3Y1M2_TOBAC|nr:PREDICTED: O-acyltransferase WSD1-like isoform X1 [Nicotiana sylvestris]XP_016445897.1 PREDICTED: O-acyltransferase WSD1-like isoform X1 [Nicotiana tabacum]
MDIPLEEEIFEPASPSSQYLNSSNLSLCVIAVLESKIPIEYEESLPLNLLKDVFVPINPRFSSIMVTGKKGTRKWKRVEVNYEDHIKTPIFPSEKPLDFYNECFSNYISNLAMEQFPQNQPLWEIHIFKYPTNDAAGSVIFKLHHSLGDGYSLMGALLSCLQRVDNPSLPLTFPSRQRTTLSSKDKAFSVLKVVPRFFKGIVNTVYDFGESILKSTLVEDDRTAIHSGDEGVEFRPIVVTTKTFSLDCLKQIKASLNVTINDVITGIVEYGTRLYMQEVKQESCNGKCTALVLFNTRALGGYKSVNDMIKPNSDMPWGNHFTFLPVSLPKLTNLANRDQSSINPLAFVQKAHRMIDRKRNSASVWLTSKLLDFLRKLRGPEATARFIHGTLKNTSMALTNLIGPVEEMALANHPVKGLYFIVTGAPQSCSVTIVSYVDKLRIAMVVEKGFIDPNKLKSCIDYAFDTIFKAAVKSSPVAT